jgi:hypothetical protein
MPEDARFTAKKKKQRCLKKSWMIIERYDPCLELKSKKKNNLFLGNCQFSPTKTNLVQHFEYSDIFSSTKLHF